MKKITTFLCAFLCVSLFAEKPNATIMPLNSSIVLDGIEDATYNNITPHAINIAVDDTTPTLGESYWKAVYDGDGLYVLVNVQDDNFYPAWKANSLEYWNYDRPELYFDVNPVLEDQLGAKDSILKGHCQIAPNFTEGDDGKELSSSNNEWKYAFKVTDNNYVFEYYIPFTYFEQAPDGFNIISKIGFDVTIVDRDENSSHGRLRKTWVNDNSIDESWNNMDGCGTMQLAFCLDCNSVEEKDFIAVSIYPIPANGFINVKNAATLERVEILNLLGEVIISSKNNSVNISNLHSGNYLARIKTQNATIIKSFVKQQY